MLIFLLLFRHDDIIGVRVEAEVFFRVAVNEADEE